MERDGEHVLWGRVARPVVQFANGRSSRVVTALFGGVAVERADGLIGPGALPYDILHIVWREERTGESLRTVDLENFSHWIWNADIGGESVRVSVDLGRRETRADLAWKVGQVGAS